MAANCEALAGYWLSITYAFDQAVAYDGVLVLACAYTRPLHVDRDHSMSSRFPAALISDKKKPNLSY